MAANSNRTALCWTKYWLLATLLLFAGLVSSASANLATASFHQDRLGSVVAASTLSNVVSGRASYSEFGVGLASGNMPELVFAGRPAILAANTYPQGMLYDYRTRQYDARLGRFLQRDSIGIWGDPLAMGNGYTYAANNPLRYTDPYGLQADDEFNKLNPVDWYYHRIEPAIDSLQDSIANAATDAIRETQVYGYWMRLSSETGIQVQDNSCDIGNGVGSAARFAAEQAMLGGMGKAASVGMAAAAESNAAKALLPLAPGSRAYLRNPYGSRGKPDHQIKVDQLETKALVEAKEGDVVLREAQLRGYDSRRRPDVQTVGPDGRAKRVYEAERHPNRQRNLNREAEYDRLGLLHETHGLD